MLVGGAEHQLSRRPKGQPVPVAALGAVVEDAAVVPGSVVIEQAQHGKATHGAEAHHPAGNAAAGKSLRDDIGLGGDLGGLGHLGVRGVQQDVHAHVPGVFVGEAAEDPVVVQLRAPPGQGRVDGAGIGLHRHRLHVQEHGVHDAGAELCDLHPVRELVCLVIGPVSGDELLLPLSLVHLKAAVDPAELHDLSAGVEQVGEAVVSGAKLPLQLQHLLGGVEGLAELGLQKVPHLRFGQLAAEGVLLGPGGHVPVVELLFVEEDGPALEEAVHRKAAEMAQPVLQADPPVPVKAVALIEKGAGGLHDLPGAHGGVQTQLRLRRFRTKPGQGGTLCQLRAIEQRLQGVPEQGLVKGGVPVLVQHGEEPFQQPVVIVPPCRAEDHVPVEVHLALGVIGLEVRHEGVVPGAGPYDVVGPPLLQVCDALLHGRSLMASVPVRWLLPFFPLSGPCPGLVKSYSVSGAQGNGPGDPGIRASSLCFTSLYATIFKRRSGRDRAERKPIC